MVKLYRRRESEPQPHFEGEDVRIMTYDNDQGNIQLQFAIVKTVGSLTMILSGDTVKDGFNSFGDSFGESLGMKYVSIKKKELLHGENKTSRKAVIAVVVTVAVCIIVGSLIFGVWQYKKR